MPDYTFIRDKKGAIIGIIVPAGQPFKVIFTNGRKSSVRSQKPTKRRVIPNPEQYTKTEHWNVVKQVFEKKPVLAYDSLMLALSRRYKVGLTKIKVKGGFFELLKSYGYIIREKKGFYSLAHTTAQQNEKQ